MLNLTNKSLFSAQQIGTTGASATQTMDYVDGFSLQCLLTSGDGADTNISIDASNDGTNWISVADDDITDAAPLLLLPIQSSVPYKFMRANAVSNIAGQQEITCVADVSSSLNSKYFLLDSANNGTKYYVWFNVGGTGIDPMVSGRTGVEVDISANDIADDVATATAAAIDALVLFASTSASAVVTVVNSAAGNFIAAVDSVPAPTGFSFAISVGSGLLTVLYSSYGAKSVQS